MFVPSSNERPVGRYPSPSPLSRFSSSCISFHFTPFRGPMLPAGPSLFKSPLPRLQWLPDLQDMGPDWGPRSLRSVFYPGSPSSQRRGPQSSPWSATHALSAPSSMGRCNPGRASSTLRCTLPAHATPAPPPPSSPILQQQFPCTSSPSSSSQAESRTPHVLLLSTDAVRSVSRNPA